MSNVSASGEHLTALAASLRARGDKVASELLDSMTPQRDAMTKPGSVVAFNATAAYHETDTPVVLLLAADVLRSRGWVVEQLWHASEKAAWAVVLRPLSAVTIGELVGLSDAVDLLPEGCFDRPAYPD